MYSIKEIKKSQSKKQQKNSLRKEFIHNLHINKSDVYSPLVYANIEKYLMKEYGSKDKILSSSDLLEKINSKFVLKEIDYRYENGGYSGSGVMKAMALNLFMQNAKKNNFWK